ncbi:hypothetical protein EOL70_03585 [Leucothrix sargassi]|nr:hypothetical protein EOL70_03585 [Leucothrix sargassi]
MNNKLRLLLAGLTISLAAGCSSNPASLDRKALSENKITKIDLVSPSQLTYQKSRSASHAASYAIGGFIGGAIGAGVDIAVNARRAKAMQPMIDALGNYDLSQVLANKLRRTSGNSIAGNVVVSVTQKPVTSAVNVLNVTSHYTLLPNHQTVSVTAKTAIKTKKDGSLYQRSFQAASPIDFNGQTNVNATQYLTENSGPLKQAIESAMDNVVQQISQDINNGAAK